MQHTIRTVSFTVLATLAIGSSASAVSAGDGTAPPARSAAWCDHAQEFITRLDARQAGIRDRIAELTETRERAFGAGRTKLVARIDHHIIVLEGRLERLDVRADRAPVWVAKRCPSL